MKQQLPETQITTIADIEFVLTQTDEEVQTEGKRQRGLPGTCKHTSHVWKHARTERRLRIDTVHRQYLSQNYQNISRRIICDITSKLRVAETIGAVQRHFRFACYSPAASSENIETTKTCNIMCDFMGSLFRGTGEQLHVDPNLVKSIPKVSQEEFCTTLKHMSRGTCRDTKHVMVEMIVCGGRAANRVDQHVSSFSYCGKINPEWRETCFTLLPKTGDLQDPANWRPISILREYCNTCACIIYNRLKDFAQAKQGA
eukprot:11160167-Lingulodinium_polyedra.AAC.2